MDDLSQFNLPLSFGKQSGKKKDPAAASEPAPTNSTKPPVVPDTPHWEEKQEEDDESDKEDDDEEAYEDGVDEDSRFPISHEVTLKDHTKVVSALALDPSGARIASGSHDYDCKLWDFGGMNASLLPFKSWEPAGSYHVHDLKYSNAGDYLLVISGTTQAQIYDRDGLQCDTFAKGDPYIRDMRHTDGHVGELTSGAWHPKDPNTFITSSNDSTIRIWDVGNKRKQKTAIVVKSKDRGTRTKITSCNYSPDGTIIAGAGLDGTLHLWSTSGTYARPSSTIEGAHGKGTETGSLLFSHDGHSLLSRGGDGTVKLWDSRAFKKPVYQRDDLPSLYPETNAVFSPDEKYVIAGRSAPSRDERGGLVILNREGLDIQQTVSCEPGVGVVRVLWHPKINQIVTGLSNGQIKVLYSSTASLNGAKLLLTKSAKKITIEMASRAYLQAPILTPHALPMFRDEGEARAGGAGGKRKRDKERMDKRKTRRPEAPMTGPGRGGRVGASATQHVVQNLVRDTTRDEDVSFFLVVFFSFWLGGAENVGTTPPNYVDPEIGAGGLEIRLTSPITPFQPREALLKYARGRRTSPIPCSKTWRKRRRKARALTETSREGNNTDGVYAISGYARLGPYKAWVPQFSCTSPRAAFFRSQTPMTDIVVATHQTTIPIGTSAHYAQPFLNGNGNSHPAGNSTVETPTDNYDSDIAGSSPPGSEPIPTPSDEHVLAHDIKSNGHEIGDVEMIDGSAMDASMAPPSPAPSGMSQPISNLSLNGGRPSPPTPYASVSPSSTKPVTQHHERPVETTGAFCARPPPTPPPTHTTLSPAQFKFAQSTLRTLRKQKDAVPFNQPVDYIALGIPHYPNIIRHPMDLSTVDKKLAASNPSKPDPGSNPHAATVSRYYSVPELIADLKLTFDNCYAFNGPDHLVSQCARRLQASLDRALKNMPPPQAVANPNFQSPHSSTSTTPPPPAPEPKEVKKPVRRSSNAIPTIRRSDESSASEFVSARPKREIHPPPPKDIDYAEPTAVAKRPKVPKASKGKRKDDGTLDQLKFCLRMVADLYKKQYANFASFFYDPVDPAVVPDYPKVIKNPMDLSTLKKNLELKLYSDAGKFYDDFQLMISNCVKFNPVGSVVYIAGQDLAKVFNEKWRALPPLHTPPPSSDEEDGGQTAEKEAIQNLETQLATIRDTIDALKTKDKKPKTSKSQSSSRGAGPSKGSSSSSAARARGATSSSKKSSTKKNVGGAGARKLDADATLTFEEKKELSDTIQHLEGSALEDVIQIIHDGVPEIGDNTDEIEIEIDALPPKVLHSLWNVVIKPKMAPPPTSASSKPTKNGRHTGTGGLKRKSMDEEAEARKMREIDARINMFSNGTGGGSPNANGTNGTTNGVEVRRTSAVTATNAGGGDADSVHSSDSESDSGSDSSDSD
ncbi:hypothetical protein BS47DRAFT_1362247 [Hydnum rufescens UP504]|uniref:Uncharacterized protein n=1 Tax=Hydnum rufescens UP504 TaxID=1448309 RepID=A0A9P6AXH8_9AGAM|nr:hypothetical protein BS47DRAFT_1362247 [Hydnum rufescens UP504]